jgi:hypothetical protein
MRLRGVEPVHRHPEGVQVVARIVRGPDRVAAFEQQDGLARFRENCGRSPTAGAGTDHDSVDRHDRPGTLVV